MRKPGKPTKFKKSYPEKAFNLYAAGLTDLELCKKLKIHLDTMYEWCKRHPGFAEARKAGKAQADEVIERSLFERAKGYSHPDTHISVWQGDVQCTRITKHYPPDPTSMIFWLKNRKPQQWREKVEVGGQLQVGVDAESLAKAIALAKEVAKKL